MAALRDRLRGLLADPGVLVPYSVLQRCTSVPSVLAEDASILQGLAREHPSAVVRRTAAEVPGQPDGPA